MGMVKAFFKQLYMAIFKPQDYYILGKVKMANSFFFVFLLCAMGAILTVFKTGKLFHIGEVTDWVRYQSPDFSFDGGRLYSEGKYFNIIEDMGIYLDTDIEQFTEEEIWEYIEKYDLEAALVVNARSFWCYSSNRLQEGYYYDFFKDPFDKEDFVENMDLFLVMAGNVLGIIGCIGYLLIFYISAVVYFIIAVILTLIFRTQCSYLELFNVCLYAKTLMFIITEICWWIPAVNTGSLAFKICSAIITMTYIIVGIFRMDKYFPKPIRYGR